MSVLARPRVTTGWDRVAPCNSCHSPAVVVVVEVDGGSGANVNRLCEPCAHSLSTQLQEMNL